MMIAESVANVTANVGRKEMAAKVGSHRIKASLEEVYVVYQDVRIDVRKVKVGSQSRVHEREVELGKRES